MNLPGTGHRDLLRILTCGSVDDGKSTLIGRLAFETQAIMDDTLATLARDSLRHGTIDDDVDLALLVDGLEAERQQGITIDVAHRFLATPRRSFIVADTPGHQQYTRNMATGASNSDLAIILVDARKGLLNQTRRHTFICSLLGIRHVVLAVNKMDLVDFSPAVFCDIADRYTALAARLGFTSVVPIPIAARAGDNVTARSGRTPWHEGPTLLGHLEEVEVARDAASGAFRFPVQWVNRPNPDFRGLAGTVVGGTVAVGDPVAAWVSGQGSRVARLCGPGGDVPQARAGEAVTIVLADELDVARGDVLVPTHDRPAAMDQFAAHILWMDDEPLLPGRQYLLRSGSLWTGASVTTIEHQVDMASLEHRAARRLEANEIGFCNISTAQRVPMEPYATNQRTGAFILVDRFTNRTAGCGMVAFPLRRALDIRPEPFLVDKAARAARNGQRPLMLWFTGLSGSGKSTVAKLVERALHEGGNHTYSLDGDNLRHGLNRDLGFTDPDRVENIRRVGEVGKLLVDAGLIVLCSFISPFRAEREMVRDMLEPGEFVEIFLDTPLEECIRRDPKGLYARAIAGTISHFTGISSPYEAPVRPDIVLRGATTTPEVLAEQVLAHIGRIQAGGPPTGDRAEPGAMAPP